MMPALLQHWLARLRSLTVGSKLDDRPTPEVLLFTRQGCHLCDEAQALLEEDGLAVKVIDVDADPALRAKYDECVPVVFIAGKERFRGRVNRVLLRRLLRTHDQGTPPSIGAHSD